MNQINDMGKLIKELREKAGLTQTALAKQVGMTRAGISAIETGKNGARATSLTLIASALGVDSNMLLKGASGGTSATSLSTAAMLGGIDEQDYVELPFVGPSAYGTFAENCQDPHNEEFSTIRVLRVPGANYTKAVVIEVKGNSMAPRYPNGCRVVARSVSDGNWQHSTGVHALALRSHMFIIKRITANKEGNMELTSDAGGETMDITLADINCMWKIGEIVYIPAED
jgi:transcriptional regulator with XRE-family HTH domain